MPQQLLLEGADLEALILQARQQYGASARIIRAEKVRRGGFLGFFTHQHFEITVEIDESAVAHAPATSLSDDDAALAAEIADAFAAREAMLAETIGSADARTTQSASPAAAVPAKASASTSRPAESTDMAEFDRLVLQLTEGKVVEPALATFTPLALGADTAPIAGAASTVLEPEPAVGDSAGEPAPPWQPFATPERLRVGGQKPASTGDGSKGVVSRWGVFTDVAGAIATECTVPALLSLGVPLRFVAEFAELDRPVPLLDVVAKFKVPPVRRPEPGDLMVIAGPPDDALAVAAQLAAWLGMPVTSVVLAGEIAAIRGHGRRIRTELEARGARRKADKAAALGEPLLVAVGVAPGRRGAAAAAPLLTAFDADTVWAVVDAKKRASAHRDQLRLLAGAGRIDALAAVGLADAQAPAAIVDADLPVAWMDGLPAASVVWAALIGERIALPD